MPPLPSPGNVLRIRLMFTIGGKPMQGVRYFMAYTGATPTTFTCEALASHLVSVWFATTVQSGYHPSVVLTNVIVEDLSSSTGASFDQHVTSGTGTRTGGELPADAAFVTGYEVGRRYRGGHGRTYWPFGTETDLTTSQKFKSASVSALQTLVDKAIAALTTHTATGTNVTKLQVVSYYEGFTVVTSPTTGRARNVPTKRVTPLVQLVTDVVGRTYVGSFRRRRLVG